MIQNTMNRPQITHEGHQKLSTELSGLKNKRDRLIVQIEEVAMPDESGEDGLATQLKEELEVVNGKIDELEEALKSAEIINGNGKSHFIHVGSKVTIRISGRHEKEFHIVSEFESDPSQNRISDQSPLGQALLGKKIDDEIEVEAPVGKITYKVVAIA